MKRISDHMYRMVEQDIPSSYGIAGFNDWLIEQRAQGKSHDKKPFI